MKTTHEKLITSLLALGLVGVSPVGAQSQNGGYNAAPNNGLAGVIFSSTPNEDLNGNGVRDTGVELDADNDGFLDRFNEGAINESTAGGLDAWNNPIAIDVNNDGVIQTGNYVADLDGDGIIGNAGQIEDLNNNGFRDGPFENASFILGEDTDRDGNLDINERNIANTDGNIFLDRGEDFDADGRLDIHNELNIVEQNIDEANYHGAGVGVDVDGDGTIETVTYDFDINGDGVIQAAAYSQDLDGDGNVDNGTERDRNRDGTFQTTEDLDGDGRFDAGEDLNQNGQPDLALNEDVNNNGTLDAGEDLNNDGILNNGGTGAPLVAGGPNTLLAGEGALINEDRNGDGNLSQSEDIDGDGTFDLVNEDLNNDGFLNNGGTAAGGGFNPGEAALINEDLNANDTLDPGEDLNNDGILNNGGSGAPLVAGGPNTLLAGEGALINEDLDADGNLDVNEDLDNDGNFDFADEDIDGDGFFDSINEDVDGDGQLDRFAEDVNQNGTLDVAARNYMTSVDPTAQGTLLDLEFIVANDLLVNGEIIATENYVDQAELDAIAASNAYTDAREVAITAAFTAADANLQRQINTNREDIDRNARGIAMVAALQHTTVLPGMTQALDLSAAHFEGETGLAINYSRRINENVQINFGAASTSDFDESVIKAGIGWQW
jgi:hypothetical protein